MFIAYIIMYKIPSKSQNALHYIFYVPAAHLSARIRTRTMIYVRASFEIVKL